MMNCLVLYRGARLSELKLVALSSDRRIIGDFADRLLD
jgi:hypothetical protein